MTTYFKQPIVRSEPYRRLVASLPCIRCVIVGYSQCAHGNTGKGFGMKTDDRQSFPLCSESGNGCHRAFDQGAMFTKEQRRLIEPGWVDQTQTTLKRMAMHDAGVRKVVEKVLCSLN